MHAVGRVSFHREAKTVGATRESRSSGSVAKRRRKNQGAEEAKDEEMRKNRGAPKSAEDPIPNLDLENFTILLTSFSTLRSPLIK